MNIEDLYTALTSPSRATKHRRMTYRCASHQCLLLDAIDAGPLGIVLHQSQYKYSETVNLAQSSAEGRAKNTVDGNRKWKARTYDIEQSALAKKFAGEQQMLLALSCDHVLSYQLTNNEFWSDWDSSQKTIRVRTDSSRYTV